MALAAGTRLGPFEIVAPLGAGGMGEVWRARDTKLGRDVALKLLPTQFAADPERLARFEREAKTLAALNHPHIAHIHGLEESGDQRALVMELVEGQTLAERIARGAIPLDETLPLAKQLAEALEYAHEHGVVHRDLKPANIKITPDGAVKVLDFGLAKALGVGPLDADPSNSPTITSPAMTRAGVILGTAAYMSPEQARGATVDKRADIWAFGVVLYEMLTGRACFAGQTVTDVLAAVVKTEPDWTALPSVTPARVRDLLRHCLTKDPKQRLHDIGDARLEIDEAIARGPLDGAPESLATSTRIVGATRRQTLAWTLLGVALATLGAASLVLSGVSPRVRPEVPRPLRVSVVHSNGGGVGAPAISPDARRIAYAARRTDGMPVLWVRDLATGETRALEGTEGASYPFWSPTSRDLAFFAGTLLKRIPADGGPVRIVAKSHLNRGSGSWAPDGTIVFSSGDNTPLSRVNADGGIVTPATERAEAYSYYSPSFLPDGHRFLFTRKEWTVGAEASGGGIFLGSLDSPETQRLLPDLSSAVYAPPGYLVFIRDRTLTAVPFDLDQGRVAGEPTQIGGAVAITSASYAAALSVAADGTLAVRSPASAPGSPGVQLQLIERGGAVKSIGEPQNYTFQMQLTPDGRAVAALITDPRSDTTDLWLVDLQTGQRKALTTLRGIVVAPVWSPDGTRLAYVWARPRQPGDESDRFTYWSSVVMVKDFRSGQVLTLIEGPHAMLSWAWSHDGAHLLFTERDDAKQTSTLYAWSFASNTRIPLAGSAWGPAAFSPDDRYVAFASSESGRFEVSVTTFAEPRQTWPLTTEGGRPFSWSADGREILVTTLAGHIVAYPVSTEGGFSAGQASVLVRDVGSEAIYNAAARDHSRILIRLRPDAAKDNGEIQLLFGWQAALTQRGRR